MRRRQAERSDTTRRLIIDAARGLFAEHGFAHTRIEQIAEAAGVSKGALYHHYRDKTEVLAAVYEDLARHMAEAVLRDAEDAADPLEALSDGTRRFLDACADPAYRQIALIDVPAGLGWERWRQIDADAGGFGLLRRGLQAAADADLIAADHIDERASLYLAALNEAALVVARSPTPDATRKTMAELLDQELQALRRPA